MIVLGFAVPGWFPLLWVAFVPVLTAVSGTTARGAMFLGMLLGGLTAFAGHVWSWFGTSCEPWMHLILASLRSIETRRAMMRCTNMGISAFIDPVGRIRQRSEEAIVIGEVPLIRDRSTTLYLKYGNWLGGTCL